MPHSLKSRFPGVPQAGLAQIAALEKKRPKSPVKIKQVIRKVTQAPIASTMPVSGPAGGGFITRGPSVEGQALIPQIPINPSRVPSGTPILTGFGPSPGGLIRGGLVAGSRFLLRAPGTRQLAEKLSGRATTLRPLFGKGPTLQQAATFTGGVIAAETIIGAGEALIDRAERAFAGREADPTPQRGLATMRHGTGRAIATLPAVGGMLPPGTTVVKTWSTGTANFARLADGRMAVQRKDGTIKVWRPQKHIVIPRNPRVGTLIRADKRLQRLTTGLRKVVDRGRTTRRK